jgi:hypothetical protein
MPNPRKCLLLSLQDLQRSFLNHLHSLCGIPELVKHVHLQSMVDITLVSVSCIPSADEGVSLFTGMRRVCEVPVGRRQFVQVPVCGKRVMFADVLTAAPRMRWATAYPI